MKSNKLRLSFLFLMLCGLAANHALAAESKNAAAKNDSPVVTKLKVLFLCTGNSCRSQMAEGFARELKSDVIEPYSAGVKPSGKNPKAVLVMKEAGIDISQQASKDVKDVMDVPFDYVVAVCSNAEETCPVFPGKVRLVRHLFDDPPKLEKEVEGEEAKLNCYRRVRDEIKAYVLTLPESLEKEVVPAEPEISAQTGTVKKNVERKSFRNRIWQRIRRAR